MCCATDTAADISQRISICNVRESQETNWIFILCCNPHARFRRCNRSNFALTKTVRNVNHIRANFLCASLSRRTSVRSFSTTNEHTCAVSVAVKVIWQFELFVFSCDLLSIFAMDPQHSSLFWMVFAPIRDRRQLDCSLIAVFTSAVSFFSLLFLENQHKSRSRINAFACFCFQRSWSWTRCQCSSNGGGEWD